MTILSPDRLTSSAQRSSIARGERSTDRPADTSAAQGAQVRWIDSVEAFEDLDLLAPTEPRRAPHAQASFRLRRPAPCATDPLRRFRAGGARSVVVVSNYSVHFRRFAAPGGLIRIVGARPSVCPRLPQQGIPIRPSRLAVVPAVAILVSACSSGGATPSTPAAATSSATAGRRDPHRGGAHRCSQDRADLDDGPGQSCGDLRGHQQWQH